MVDDEKYYKFYDRKRLTPNGSVISNLLLLRPFYCFISGVVGELDLQPGRASMSTRTGCFPTFQLGLCFGLATLQLELAMHSQAHSFQIHMRNINFCSSDPYQIDETSQRMFKDLGITMSAEAHC